MKRKTSSVVIKRNKPILKRIEELKKEHPFWGYRRIWAHLTYVDQMSVNKKRVYNLMKRNNLLVNKKTRLRAKICLEKLPTLWLAKTGSKLLYFPFTSFRVFCFSLSRYLRLLGFLLFLETSPSIPFNCSNFLSYRLKLGLFHLAPTR